MNNLVMAAADLLIRAAIVVRQRGRTASGVVDAAEQARAMLVRPIDPEADYREGLMALGVMFDAIDAAVVELNADRAPEDSLEGWLIEQQKDAERCAAASSTDSRRQAMLFGEARAFGYVLEHIGCKAKA